MRGKLLFITGGVVGYVLGARAGRKRYDQIAAVANDLWNAPPVQRRVTVVRDFTLDAVGDLPATLYSAGKKAFTAAQNKNAASTDSPNRTSQPSPADGASDADASAVTTTAAVGATAAKPSAKKSASSAKSAPKRPAATPRSAGPAEPKSPNER